MSDIPKTVRPDVVPASVQHLDGLLGPLAAYLGRAGGEDLRARAAVVDCAVDDGDGRSDLRAGHCGDEPERAVRAGELSVAGYVGRSPRSLAMPRAAGSLPDRPQRRRLLRSPASIAGERERGRRGGMAGLYLPGMTSRVGPKGQVVIPKAIRDQVQLHPGDEVEVDLQDDCIIITARRHADALGGKFAHSGMAARLLDDRAREPR